MALPEINENDYETFEDYEQAVEDSKIAETVTTAPQAELDPTYDQQIVLNEQEQLRRDKANKLRAAGQHYEANEADYYGNLYKEEREELDAPRKEAEDAEISQAVAAHRKAHLDAAMKNTAGWAQEKANASEEKLDHMVKSAATYAAQQNENTEGEDFYYVFGDSAEGRDPAFRIEKMSLTPEVKAEIMQLHRDSGDSFFDIVRKNPHTQNYVPEPEPLEVIDINDDEAIKKLTSAQAEKQPQPIFEKWRILTDLNAVRKQPNVMFPKTIG